MIDSSDRGGLETAKTELVALFKDQRLKNSIFMILLNKQDLNDCISTQQAIEILELKRKTEFSWAIFGVSVKKWEGMTEAFDWLSTKLKDIYHL